METPRDDLREQAEEMERRNRIFNLTYYLQHKEEIDRIQRETRDQLEESVMNLPQTE